MLLVKIINFLIKTKTYVQSGIVLFQKRKIKKIGEIRPPVISGK
jgi:hypothetical protein